MNVLLLTPDAVGSTLLQRLITIYMQFHTFDQPVINLHELTNGLEKFYSPDFNQEILTKPNRVNKEWGYYQSLKQVTELLTSVDHYKTARLAEYHIKSRKDTIADQIPFYQYLDDNFFIISCRRRNLFEHALSWGLNKITKKLNVYSADEKVNSFYDIYKNQVELDLQAFTHSLDRYRSYLTWCDNHFNVASYFYYEDHIDNPEKYILNLPIFSNQPKKITWQDTYNIDFSAWNQTHYYLSNVGSLALESSEKLLLLSNNVKINTDPDSEYAMLDITQQQLVPNLPESQQQHIKKNIKAYQAAHESISLMQNLGILVTPVPIKKQTFAEKKFMIKNFDQCLKVYNAWADKNSDIAETVDADKLNSDIQRDLDVWKASSTDDSSVTDQLLLPPIG
jgi:hypothetical protein